MKIRNVEREDIDNALRKVNEKYAGNLWLETVNDLGNTRKGKLWKIKIRVKDSANPGSRITAQTHHRLAEPCWHVWGDFFDHLPDNAEAYIIDESRRKLAWRNPHLTGRVDWDKGSRAFSEPTSTLCNCKKYGLNQE